MTILLLDNDPKNIKSFTRYLEENKYKVKIAVDYNEAIKHLFSDLSISLIITEIGFLENDGFMLLNFLKENLRFSEKPVVVCSSNLDNEKVTQAVRLGVKAFLVKPVKSEGLLEKIKEVLDLGKGKVLVVSNDHVVSSIFTRTLAREGYNVLLSSSGEEAVELLKENKVDYLISEFELPEMNGLDLLVVLKDEHPEIPVIIALESNSSLSEDEVIAAGADSVIKKPYNNTEIIHKIITLKQLKLAGAAR